MDKFEGFKFKKIWKGAFNDLFKRGLKAYVILIGILFVFSFLGISGQYAFLDVDRVDDAAGTMQTDDYAVQFVTDYAMSNKLIQLIPELIREGVVMPFITANASYAGWLLSVLLLNEEYVARNRGEVFVILVILSYAVMQFIYFIKRGFLVGQIRYQMECHVRKDVKIRRIMSPFSDYKFWHVFRVMAVHNLVLFLWGLTIIGGIIKSYQYYFVPYILAENPDVSWTQVKNLSKAKVSLVEIIENLSAISEENAASTHETSTSMNELGSTFSVINESAAQLKALAADLTETIGYFN